MSVLSEINRIQTNIDNSLDAVAAYGVSVQSTDTSNELPARIAEISLVLPNKYVTLDTDLTIDSNKVFSKSISGNTSIVWNLLVKNGNFINSDIWLSYNASILIIDNLITISRILSGASSVSLNIGDSYIVGHKYFISVYHKGDGVDIGFGAGTLLADPTSISCDTLNVFTRNCGILTPITSNRSYLGIRLYGSSTLSLLRSFTTFDLTLMFGAGNEPTLEEFKSMFPLDYYEYNSGSTIEKALLVGSNLNAPILYEGGLKLSDKYNVNLGVDSVSAIGTNLYGATTASGLASVMAGNLFTYKDSDNMTSQAWNAYFSGLVPNKNAVVVYRATSFSTNTEYVDMRRVTTSASGVCQFSPKETFIGVLHALFLYI